MGGWGKYGEAGKRVQVWVLVTQSCRTPCDAWTEASQVPLATEFSRQEHWRVSHSKLAAIRRIQSEGLMYSMVTVVDNTVLNN